MPRELTSYVSPTLETITFHCSSLIAESMHEEPGKWSPGPETDFFQNENT